MKVELKAIRDDVLALGDDVGTYVRNSEMSPHRYFNYLETVAKCHVHLMGRVEVTHEDIMYIRDKVMPLSISALKVEAKAFKESEMKKNDKQQIVHLD